MFCHAIVSFRVCCLYDPLSSGYLLYSGHFVSKPIIYLNLVFLYFSKGLSLTDPNTEIKAYCVLLFVGYVSNLTRTEAEQSVASQS